MAPSSERTQLPTSTTDGPKNLQTPCPLTLLWFGPRGHDSATLKCTQPWVLMHALLRTLNATFRADWLTPGAVHRVVAMGEEPCFTLAIYLQLTIV